MESTLHKIRDLYSKMGHAERRVADYILEHTDDILDVSISELAQKCGCSDATLVRFSRRLGLDGFGKLKLALAGELQKTSALSGEIFDDDDPYTIYKKRIRDIEASLYNTESVLSPDALLDAANKLMSANRIVTFGLGSSAAVAQDAAHKFMRLGFVAQAITDNHMQAIVASHLRRGDVALGISHSGASKDIVEALDLSRACGATTICITNFDKTPVHAVSDIVLHTKAEETKYSILAMSSRIAQLSILDSIYTYIVLNARSRVGREIFNTEYALQSKKM